jgi:hypothetical protein
LGKSTVSQQEAVWIDEARSAATMFHIDMENVGNQMQHGTSKRVTNAYITYSYSEAIESLTELTNDGDTTIMDEFQPPHGVGSGKQKDNLVVVMESCTRAASKNFIINTPREHELPEVSLVFEVIGMNVETRQNLAIMTIPKKDGVNIKRFLGIVVFDIELSDEFLAWYRVQSKLIKKQIEAAGGASGAGGLSEKKMEKYAKLLLAKLGDIPGGKYKQFILETNDKGGYKHIDVLVQRISMIAVLDEKAIKAVVDYAFFEHEPLPMPMLAADTGTPVSTRELKRRYAATGTVTDEEVAQAELARATDDSKRLTFLRNGLNVPRQAIDAYLAGSITMETLQELSRVQNDATRARIRDARVLDQVAGAMTMFQDERERFLDAIVATELARATPEGSEPGTGQTMALAGDPDAPFEFNEEASLQEYIKETGDERGVKIFQDLKDLSVEAVMAKWTNLQTGEPLTEPGVKKIEDRVAGVISNEIGHAYEPHFAAAKDKEFAGQLVGPPECLGVKGKKQPDVVVRFLSGEFTIYSLKAHYSTRSATFTHKGSDFDPEIDKWKALSKGPPERHGKLVIVYYDHNDGKVVEKEVPDPNHPPLKIRMSRVKKAPVITFFS